MEGFPRPQITWFKQTQVLLPSSDFQIYYDDDNVATLIISEVFAEDAGTYTCVAKNAAGFASSTTELIVETISDHETTAMSRKTMSRESSMADIVDGMPPVFAKKPRAQIVDEDSNVMLEARLVAVPEPEITWLFNKKEVSEETVKNVRIVTKSDTYTYSTILQIKKVKKTQEGTYEIIARNREGQASVKIPLKVKTDDSEKPEVLEPLKNLLIREKEPIILTTHIIGNPTPTVEWLKNGKPVKHKTVCENNTYVMVIKTSKLSDSGEYTVRATNKAGTVETKATVAIEGKINLYFVHYFSIY